MKQERAIALAGSGAFLLVAPGTVAVVVPWLVTRWRGGPPLLGLAPLAALGWALALLGSVGLFDSFRRFAVEGLGTPAPVHPPGRLVVTGLYRFVRNPMYVGVVSAVLGQALIFGSAPLAFYAALLWLFFHVFVVAREEPALRRRFPADYSAYCAHVGRWLPRLTPWRDAPPA